MHDNPDGALRNQLQIRRKPSLQCVSKQKHWLSGQLHQKFLSRLQSAHQVPLFGQKYLSLSPTYFCLMVFQGQIERSA
jgi:hypothetical protein